MKIKTNQPTWSHYSLVAGLFLMVSSSLVGCNQPPKSLYEQQAEVESANEIKTRANVSQPAAVVAPVTPAMTRNPAIISLNIIKKRAVAKQPNCDPAQTDCQYSELNFLDFNPAQPWLTSIMWQTVARVLAPETPLASQDETAKKTVLMLFKQIEYSEQVVSTLPMYQRVDTELVLNPTIGGLQAESHISAVSNKLGSADTGYLAIQSRQQRGAKGQIEMSYVMLDMQKKLQLTLNDILLPQVTTNELLLAFQLVKNDWLALQSIEQDDLENQPLPLSTQWYLDDKGLHMVYQSGELAARQTEVVDLVVPYARLKGLIKPSYIVPTAANSKS